MEQSSNDISHPVRDAFQELGHKARTVATSAYVTLPFLMASAPSVAYGHETGEAHIHMGLVDYMDTMAYTLLGFVLGAHLAILSKNGVDRLFTFFENKKYR